MLWVVKTTVRNVLVLISKSEILRSNTLSLSTLYSVLSTQYPVPCTPCCCYYPFEGILSIPSFVLKKKNPCQTRDTSDCIFFFGLRIKRSPYPLIPYPITHTFYPIPLTLKGYQLTFSKGHYQYHLYHLFFLKKKNSWLYNYCAFSIPSCILSSQRRDTNSNHGYTIIAQIYYFLFAKKGY